MNSQQYWRKRVLYAKQKELESEADYEDAMRSRLKDLENEFIKESKIWLSKYAKENNQTLKQAAEYLKKIDTSKFDMTLAEFEAKARAGGYEKELNSAYYKSRIARLQELYKQYQELAAKYADSEEDNLAIGLAKQYQDTYLLDNYNQYLVVGSINVNFAHFNEDQLKEIVYQPWQGSDFSKRIWANYTNVMPEVLTDTMLRATVMGYSYQDVEKQLKDKFQGVVRSDLHRLVATEMGHAAEQATLQFYKDSKIEQYEYMATLESHTCDVCAHLDGRIFYVKDKKEGVNYPLIHPYCRCTTCGYIKDLPNITSRWSRDTKTGKGKWVKNQPYSEWAKSNGQKTYTFTQWKQIQGIKPLRLGISKTLSAAKLNKDEERAIKQYISSESYKVNCALRNNEPLTKDQQKMVNNLDNALKKMRLNY
ncbi:MULTISPECIES: minor capsid protein [Lactobacillus]|uniref:minor capsid protein n=1 Tax=Lactobacillus TaxID=1578 RepID=UPI000CD9440F|nr:MULTISPECIES: minor capsid protein [Lactobacillus]RVU73606.1 phage head morphogenesis protein [Lactobacillus xujianguonis]